MLAMVSRRRSSKARLPPGPDPARFAIIPDTAPGPLRQRRLERAELPEPRSAQLPVEEDRPQALVLDLLLELADVRLHGRVAPPYRVGEDVIERLDLFLAEPLDPVELALKLRVGREIPRHASLLVSRRDNRAAARSASRAASASTTRSPASPGSAGVRSLAAKPSSAMCPAR